MTQLERFNETIATYTKHGWQLRRVLLSDETRRALLQTGSAEALFAEASVEEAPVDAVWFARDSHGGREAWELRLIAETPYALFETFEADEEEEEREEVRTEMQARLRAYAAPPAS